MVGCTIPFCTNSSDKGYSMKILPRDVQRRNKWISDINNKYANWIPAKNSCLCEVKLFVMNIYNVIIYCLIIMLIGAF